MKRPVFKIRTPSVEGNKIMNIPKERRHAHKWTEYPMGLVCTECGEKRGGFMNKQ